MSRAFVGIATPSAFSTARTRGRGHAAGAAVPQMRWASSQASRGSRPRRMSSDAAEHRRRAPRVAHDAAMTLGLDPQVAADAGDRIDHDPGHVSAPPGRSGHRSAGRRRPWRPGRPAAAGGHRRGGSARAPASAGGLHVAARAGPPPRSAPRSPGRRRPPSRRPPAASAAAVALRRPPALPLRRMLPGRVRSCRARRVTAATPPTRATPTWSAVTGAANGSGDGRRL